VVLADSVAHPIAASTTFATFHQVPSARFDPQGYATAINALVRAHDIDLIIPTCEEVFHLARLAQENALDAPVDAPPLQALAAAHDKSAFIQTARGLGQAVPETQLLRCADDVRRFVRDARDWVFKPVWSRFANAVLIRPTQAQLRGLVPTPDAPWVAQRFLKGQEISVYAVARQGELRALAAYVSRFRAGKGAGVCFDPVQDPQVERFVRAFIAGTGWEGQISFDLMRMPDGQVLPIECNPRATSGLHFFSEGAAFADALLHGGPRVEPDVRGPLGVRLALWVYGIPAVLRRRAGPRALFHALRETRDVLDWPEDPGPRQAQLPVLWGIVKTAARKQISLQAATTQDIEWNGPDDPAGRL